MDNISITLPTQMKYTVKFIGNVRLTKDLLLATVLFVPTFAYNLLFISTLLKDTCYSVSFSANDCHIQDRSHSKLIGKVEQRDGLYMLSLPKIPHKDNIALACKASFETWHRRLGHLSSPRLLSLKNILPFTDFNHSETVCHICPLAKQRRLSFPALIMFQPMYLI